MNQADTAAEERTDDEDCNGKQELAGHVKRTLRTNYSLLKRREPIFLFQTDIARFAGFLFKELFLYD